MRRFLVSVARPALVSRPLPSFTAYSRAFATTGTQASGKTNAPSTKDGDASRRTGDYGPADTDAKPLEQEGQGGKGGATGGNVGQRSTADKSASSDSTKKSSTTTGGSQPKRSFATDSHSKQSSHQSKATGKQTSQADAAEKAKAGKDATHSSPTPTPEEAQKRKASGKSAVAGDSASAVHRKQEEYTKHRDQASASESSVAADRAAHDPLPDHLKHSTKVNKN